MKESEYDINPDKFDREKDPESEYPTKKYKNYKDRLPVYIELLGITDTFLKKGLEKEKWIPKMSRVAKPAKASKSKSKEKKKKESTLTSQDLTTLIKVKLGNQVQKEEEKLGYYSIFNMPPSKYISNFK